jgi:hypothetical protein
VRALELCSTSCLRLLQLLRRRRPSSCGWRTPQTSDRWRKQHSGFSTLHTSGACAKCRREQQRVQAARAVKRLTPDSSKDMTPSSPCCRSRMHIPANPRTQHLLALYMQRAPGICCWHPVTHALLAICRIHSIHIPCRPCTVANRANHDSGLSFGRTLL